MESIPSATVGPLASVWPFGMETVTVTAGMPVVGGDLLHRKGGIHEGELRT